MGVVIVGKKQLEKYIQSTLTITYQYLINTLNENNILLPDKISDLEKYVEQLNKMRQEEQL